MLNSAPVIRPALDELSERSYDLIVIGGGIYGACVTWDAALRGLEVLLLERGDFGYATSANSLKIIHGGLRYLQDADLRLVRKMTIERRIWMQIAPHLVHPLACVTPTYGGLLRSRPALAAALAINDLVGFDRNQNVDPGSKLPPGHTVSREACLEMMPGYEDDSLTGGAVWYDGQMYSSERMTLGIVLAAQAAGAQVLNYAEATEPIIQDDRVAGLQVRDTLTGAEYELSSHMTVNTASSWDVGSLKSRMQTPALEALVPSLAVNLMIPGTLADKALGIPSRTTFKQGRAFPLEKPQVLFFTPWRGRTIVGTFHRPLQEAVDLELSADQVSDFVAEINAAYPAADLQAEDVLLVHRGVLPAHAGSPEEVKLLREGLLVDHDADADLGGLVTVVGVKYTAARQVAAEAVDLVMNKLDRPDPGCRTQATPIHGGDIADLEDLLAAAYRGYGDRFSREVLQNLVFNYGTEFKAVLERARQDPNLAQQLCAGVPVLAAEVVHAVEKEAAVRLTDVVLRRTDLGSFAEPQEGCVRACAVLMAGLLNWDETRVEREFEELQNAYRVRRPLLEPVG